MAKKIKVKLSRKQLEDLYDWINHWEYTIAEKRPENKDEMKRANKLDDKIHKALVKIRGC